MVGSILPFWGTVVAWLALFALFTVLVERWSRREGWGPQHRLALAGGALLTYAWHGFPQQPMLGDAGTIDLIGNVVFATGAVVLLAVAAFTLKRVRQPT